MDGEVERWTGIWIDRQTERYEDGKNMDGQTNVDMVR